MRISRRSSIAYRLGSAAALLLFALQPAPALAQDAGADSAHDSLAEVGAKLSDPTSNVWAMFTEFDLTFSDGDVNTGDPKVGGNMLFQPILPVPLYGEGANQWKFLVRPTLPFVFRNAVPTGFNSFDYETGLGDLLLPVPLVPPAGNWLLGLGPTFLFPTATKDAFGTEQFAIGPTAIIGYKTKDWILGAFPQYFFKIGSIGDQAGKPDASFMQLLYFGWLNLPDAWQVGLSPVISYDDKATKGNKWNVPIGLAVAKTTAIAKQPVKFQFGVEYSVVSEDDYGKRFLIKLNVIPVIESLIKNPIFGGN
jgi:hypothetical protein